MDILTLLLLALGLTMDAFAVSVTNGMCMKDLKTHHALLIAAAFGIFQGLMPLTGWLAGQIFVEFLTSIDHWVALILLGFIGAKMLVEGVKELRTPQSCDAKQKALSLPQLLLQAIATSIDALAVGITFASAGSTLGEVVFDISVIAAVTFVICFAGVFIGKKFGSLLGMRAQIAGGIILILLGLKIFLEGILGG
ncbi:MAG: manganese efflux pump [Oscillospiraceae bacterium]|nr:manganese efflux pump [Oscillospiraceae bacterium]